MLWMEDAFIVVGAALNFTNKVTDATTTVTDTTADLTVSGAKSALDTELVKKLNWMTGAFDDAAGSTASKAQQTFWLAFRDAWSLDGADQHNGTTVRYV